MNISGFVYRNRKAILVILLLLAIAGLYAAFRLPSAIYPEVNFPRIVIVAEAGDLPTGNMLLGVTRPLEETVSGTPGLYRVRSRTIRGEAELSLLFLSKYDMQLALQQVQSKVNDVRASLPRNTQLTVERLTPAVFPVLSFNLTGKNVSAADLNDYALYTIRPLLSRVPGVGQVRVLGDTVREIQVVVDPQQLFANHLTLQQVEDAIQKASTIEAVGRLNKDYKQFLILMSGELKSLDVIGNIVVSQPEGSDSVLYLRDVAKVFEGNQDKIMLTTGNGEPAAQINVSRQIGANIVELEQGIQEKLTELKSVLPPALKLSTVYDLAEFIKESIRSVRDAIFIGGFLSVVILLFFLREWRSTLIAACSIPLTLVITLFFMQQLNQTLNLMSLGGMAVAIGLVIDDAIVVIENIHRHLQLSRDGKETKEAVVKKATNEIIGAVAGSTFTTVVVFLPLGLVEGVAGQFFAAFSITLSIAVLVSLAISFTLIPLASERYLKLDSNREEKPNRPLASLTARYQKSLNWALSHTVIVISITLVFVLVGVFVYTRLGSGFLPTMDEGSFVLDYWFPPGTSLAEGDRVLRKVEKILIDTPEIDSFSRRTGAELGLFATAQNTGDILVRLKKDRHRGVEDIMDDVREKVETSYPSCRVEFVQILQDILGDLEGSPEPVEIKIFGDDLQRIKERALVIAKQVEKIPGVVDLFSGVQEGNPEIQIDLDPTRVVRAGLNAESVAHQVSSALLGNVVAQVRQFDRLIGVRVRFPDETRFRYDVIQQFPLFNEKTGAIIPLNSIASLKEVNGQSELLRENQRQMIAVTARISGSSLGEVINEVKKIMLHTPLPPGYTYELGGQYQSQQHSFQQLLLVLFMGVMLVFVLLVIQFRDFLASLVILSAAPVSLVGALLMLWITRTEFNVSSFMGLIMLIGLIVKNGIILIEYTFQLEHQQGLSLRKALLEAGKTRLRPILMTTLATLFGLLPLALGIGAGSELQKPLALAVIGGLSLSMLVTLLFVPVLLLKLESKRGEQTA
jgi:CzcA family heavy metal efflux pump